MPRQAIAYVALIIIGAILGVYFSARLLRTEKSWSDALTKVREANEAKAPQLVNERRKLKELQSELAMENLGWDRFWANVGTTPNRNNRTLNVQIGTNNGLVAAAGQAAPVLHAFQPDTRGGFVYVGPFVVQPGSIRANQAALVAAWPPLRNEQGNVDPWLPGQWRFRTQIPVSNKKRFESLAARFATDQQTLRETIAGTAKQDNLFQAANAQLDLRTTELQGTQDPDAEVDPLRPELTRGLVTAIEDEEEARNTLQLEVDAIRRAILDAKQVTADYLAKIQQSATSATSSTPRLGSRPE